MLETSIHPSTHPFICCMMSHKNTVFCSNVCIAVMPCNPSQIKREGLFSTLTGCVRAYRPLLHAVFLSFSLPFLTTSSDALRHRSGPSQLSKSEIITGSDDVTGLLFSLCGATNFVGGKVWHSSPRLNEINVIFCSFLFVGQLYIS